MNELHPVAKLMRRHSLNNSYTIDSLSLRHARFEPEKFIHDELISGIVKHFKDNVNVEDVISKQEDEGFNTVYKARLFVLTEKQMFDLMSEAFRQGAELEYNSMQRLLADKLGEGKTNDAKTDSE